LYVYELLRNKDIRILRTFVLLWVIEK